MSTEQEKEKTTEPAQEQPAEPKGPELAPLKGILGTKIGMTRVFAEDTRMVPVTVISSEGVVVSQVKTKEKDGYNAVQVGYMDVPERKLSKAEAAHFSKKGLPLKRTTHEFRVDDPAPFKTGQVVSVSGFQKGDWVQVSGLTKGKGFTGAMKRYGFHGGPHSHGHGEYRRAPGSSGGQGPQHVLPGTKKPGHKGHIWSTVPTVEVIDVDTERSLILLGGSVPGPNGNLVVLGPSNRKKAGQSGDAAAGKKQKGKK